MKRKVLVILGVIAVPALLISVWLYLIMNGSPNSVTSAITNFGLSNPTVERPYTPTSTTPDETQLEIAATELQQLTTRAVAGYRFYHSTTSDYVLYAEQGTGHVFKLDLTSKTEDRLSAITHTRIVSANFNPEASWVVLGSEVNGVIEFEVLSLTGETFTAANLATNISNLQPLSADELIYTVWANNKNTATVLNVVTSTSTTIWSVPFHEIEVTWLAGNDVFIQKPAPYLKSQLFMVDQNSQLTDLTEALYNHDVIVDTTNHFYRSYFDTTAGSQVNLEEADAFIPVSLYINSEKCTIAANTALWCANEFADTSDRTYGQSLAMGNHRSDDVLWRTAFQSSESVLKVSPSNSIGYSLDIVDLSVSADESYVFFVNKNDGALWLYRPNLENNTALQAETNTNDTEVE